MTYYVLVEGVIRHYRNSLDYLKLDCEKNNIPFVESNVVEVEEEPVYLNGTFYFKGEEPKEEVIKAENEQIRQKRQARYIAEADPLRLDWDESSARGEEQAEEKKQLWLAKKDEIRNDLPYIEEAV